MIKGPLASPVSRRLPLLDLARGLAVVAMAIYHFSWDLSWFAFTGWDVAQGTGWRIFAACIAGSFLFLAGVSLEFAHHRAIRWRAFWQREGLIVGAAAAVSLVTFLVFADTFVRFGILHCIAAASLIALPFCRLPMPATVAASAFFLSLPLWATALVPAQAFDGPLWLWTGLGTPGFSSVDYVPVAPWAGVTLAGVAVSQGFRRYSLWEGLAAIGLDAAPGRILRTFGRHSLAIYLLHQPVLYGLVWLAASTGLQGDRAEISFIQDCTRICTAVAGSAPACEAACSCTVDGLKMEGTWQPLIDEPQNQSLRARMNSKYAMCMAETDGGATRD